MANVIGLMGESGSGKTTSLETLDPKTTFIINSDKKRLPFKKSIRDQYTVDNKNYYITDNQSVALSVLQKIDKQNNMKHIKTAVIDTINGIMVADESRRRKEKNYDKWTDLAWAVYDIIDYALTARDDLTVILVAHVQLDRDDDGYKFAHIKTSGKKLDKIGIETKLTTVLYSKAVPDGDTVKYVFETRAMNSTAKTPRGVFADLEVPNDMAAVLQRLEEY
jgi:hypothetical protein